MADQRSRLTRIRQGLTPAEWARFGGMVATVIGLNVVGWGMLAAALGGHYHIGKTAVFGDLGMPRLRHCRRQGVLS